MFKYLQAVVPDYIEIFWVPDAAHSLCVRDNRLADNQDCIMVRFASAHGQGGQVTDVSVLQPPSEDYLLRSNSAAAAATASSSSSGDNGDGDDSGGGGGGGGSTRFSGRQRTRRPTRPRTTADARWNWWSKLALLRGLVHVPLHEFPDKLVQAVKEEVE